MCALFALTKINMNYTTFHGKMKQRLCGMS